MNNVDHQGLDKNLLPRHVGIIMDGNGRWAKSRNQRRSYGHQEGSKRVKEIVEATYKLDIPYLSLYAFSTENWKRPAKEIENLMILLSKYIDEYIDEMDANNIKLNVMGDISVFSDKLHEKLVKAINRTKKNSKMIVNIGLNYGGQDEILHAVNLIIDDISTGKLAPKSLTKEDFKSYLYTKNQPDLDLLIRPSGELRVSNFMLYQLAYAEFWFSNILWPDFTEEVYYRALYDYQNRHRRFGGL